VGRGNAKENTGAFRVSGFKHRWRGKDQKRKKKRGWREMQTLRHRKNVQSSNGNGDKRKEGCARFLVVCVGLGKIFGE